MDLDKIQVDMYRQIDVNRYRWIQIDVARQAGEE